ncbi:hypothetical protein MWN52_11000 [Pseudoxanthomonas winnipegensis]|uniref:hypothetical protein n=1 Tax=Pseudoxanthomonas winnipegensis TaxID=2480810 RepID=UPI0025749F66|nr:hypothetical protein [Pseudoxanthomonas winnipegensis]WJI14181.1 hypothetical protein MWN52_11000 [Pseudoxanthomonas winnipegensis]
MKSKKRITHAYCVEADAVLPIAGARQFYFLNPGREYLSFLCSTDICRNRKVKVTGVNYRILPQEGSNLQVAHYRANPIDEHDPSCEWVGLEEALAQRPGESTEQFLERKAKGKLNDHVDYFDPSSADSEDEERPGSFATDMGSRVAGRLPRKGGGSSKARYATNSLERLVQYYREAKDSLPKEEFEALTLNIGGTSVIPLRTYFRSMEKARSGENNRVLVGGAKYKEYGKGFRFDFFDKLDGKPISLYVDSTTIEAYRFRGYWRELFKQAGQVKYFRVYVLGSLKERLEGKGYNVVVADLRHLAITLGPEKIS